MAAEIRRQSEAEDVLLLGRRTFLELRSFWPEQTSDETGIAAHLDRVAKHVVSATLTDPASTDEHRAGRRLARPGAQAEAPGRRRHRRHGQHLALPRPRRSPAEWTSTASSSTPSRRAEDDASSRTVAAPGWHCARAAGSPTASCS